MPQVFLPQIQSVPHTGSVDEKFAALVRDINKTLSLLPWGPLLALSTSGGLQFTQSLSLASNKITDLAVATKDTDAVPLSQVQSLIAAVVAAQLQSDDLHAKVKNTEAEIATRATTAANAEKWHGKQLLTGSQVIDFGAIGGGTIGVATISVPGAVPNDGVALSAPATLEADMVFCGFVSAPGVVTVRLYSVAVVDPAPGTWTAYIVH